jgi:excisionase family DNA binding protein
MPEILTLAEAATYLRLDENAIRKLTDEQGLPGRRLGEEWRFSKAAIQKWLSHELDVTGKAAQLAVAGSWKDDPNVDEELADTYRSRA